MLLYAKAVKKERMENLKTYQISLKGKNNINWALFSAEVKELTICKHTNTAKFKCANILNLIKKLNNIN